MRRRLLNLLTWLAAAMCVSLVILLVWSYWRWHAFELCLGKSAFQTGVDEGDLIVCFARGTEPVDDDERGFHVMSWDAGEFDHDNPPMWITMGEFFDVHEIGSHPGFSIYWSYATGDQRDDAGSVFAGGGVPAWAVALLLAILPAVRLFKWCRRVRRRKAGQCAECGYDLRASPDRCPECGKGIPTAARPVAQT